MPVLLHTLLNASQFLLQPPNVPKAFTRFLTCSFLPFLGWVRFHPLTWNQHTLVYRYSSDPLETISILDHVQVHFCLLCTVIWTSPWYHCFTTELPRSGVYSIAKSLVVGNTRVIWLCPWVSDFCCLLLLCHLLLGPYGLFVVVVVYWRIVDRSGYFWLLAVAGTQPLNKLLKAQVASVLKSLPFFYSLFI